ncbi:DUF4263 domain-containing protein [Elizabethkingia anophelis]|nr:DUF4263 domain-containing protein [Elizabethkingia anophelis]MCT4177331.1 DUF4263 domain-containing protein [Elizabethkingia anophelis]
MEFEKIEDRLILIHHISDNINYDWVRDKLEKSGVVVLKKSLSFLLSDRYPIEYEKEPYDEYFPPSAFVLGKLIDDYYRISRSVVGTTNNFFFHKDIDFKSKYFIAETNLSVLRQIDGLVKEDIYIGGTAEKSVSLEIFDKMIDEFPTTYEKKMYAKARVSSIIKNYFETTKDSELKFQKYLNTKTSKTGKKLQKIFQDYELQKFQTIQKKLNEMLKSENEYSEDQWQNEILEIILFLYPKYIFSFKSVYVKADKTKRRFLDYMLVDSNGNIDVIEIKKPFENAIMTHSLYRGNYTPHKDLTGTIMQLEKYIYHLNRYGSTGERNLTNKYKDQLPEGLEIKIINPKGIIIMGRDINLNAEQRNDFEIVRRKYKNVVDIITYDDLLRRLNYTIEQIQRL